MLRFLFLILFVFINTIISPQTVQTANIKMIFEDGQLMTNPVTVFLPDFNLKNITSIQLKLCSAELFKDVSFTQMQGRLVKPYIAADNQTKVITENGIPKTYIGTLLVFNMRDLPVQFYKSGKRYLPVIKYYSSVDTAQILGDKARFIIGKNIIYVANQKGALLLSLFICSIIIFIIYFIIKISGRSFIDLVSTFGCKTSLPLTQMALWTVAVGIIVLTYGLTQVDLPDIPDSLIWLMGLSIVTSAMGHVQSDILTDNKKANPAANTELTVAKSSFVGCLKSLISVEVDGKEYPSIAKAQFLFWTLATMTLFVYKSLIEGIIWSVPEELVILMGLSQGSYLFRNQQAINNEKTANNQTGAGKYPPTNLGDVNNTGN